jgi:predicted outer membrane repeat protein
MQANSGHGGGITASVSGEQDLTATSTSFRNNTAVNGGAVFVSGPTNDVAGGRFMCDKCTLTDNRAGTKVSRQSHNAAPHRHVPRTAAWEQCARTLSRNV